MGWRILRIWIGLKRNIRVSTIVVSSSSSRGCAYLAVTMRASLSWALLIRVLVVLIVRHDEQLCSEEKAMAGEGCDDERNKKRLIKGWRK